MKKIWRFIPLFLIISLFIAAKKYNISHYVSFNTIRLYHAELRYWVSNNFLLSILIFIFLNILIVGISIPGGIIAALLAGLLYGNILGTILVVISSTLGAILLFLAVKLAFKGTIRKKIGKDVKFMERKFRTSAFLYLLSLRLLPVVPFSLTNLVAGLFPISLRAFFVATLIGITPGVFIYVYIGSSLTSSLLASTGKFSLTTLFTSQIMIAFGLLIILSVAPLVVKHIKGAK